MPGSDMRKRAVGMMTGLFLLLAIILLRAELIRQTSAGGGAAPNLRAHLSQAGRCGAIERSRIEGGAAPEPRHRAAVAQAAGAARHAGAVIRRREDC